MRNKLHIFILITAFIAFFGSGSSLYAQNAGACNNMQTICGNPAFTFTSVSGFGLPGSSTLTVSNPANPQLTNAAGGPQNTGCMYNTNAPNPQWLLINITSSGNLGFVFGAAASPNPQTNYMNWIMWPYNANTCAGIFNNTLPPVACNFNCIASGGTGMGTIPPSGSACNYQPSIAVTQGQQYLILITNGSGIVKNVSFSSTGTAGISCNPLSVPNLTACPGQLSVVTATWLNTSNVTYTIIPCVGPTVVQSSPNFTVSSAATCVYTVLASGTNAFAQPITASKNFTLTINPTATLAVSQATNYCYGSTPTLALAPSQGTFVVSGPGYIPVTYTNGPIVLNPLYSPNNNGQFCVTGTLSTGCTVTACQQINIGPDPVFSVITSTNACMNSNVTLTASMPTATAYIWTGPGLPATPASLVTNPSQLVLANVQPTTAGNYTVTSNVNFNGITCPKTATTDVAVVKTYSVTAPASYTYCQGSSASLSASSTSAIGYSWAGPSGFSSNQQNPVITSSIVPGNGGTYTASAYFSNGVLTCATTNTSSVQVVTINPVSVLVPTLICQYATANLAVSAIGATAYAWVGPAGFTSTLNSVSIPNIQLQNSGIYTVTVIYAIGSRTCPAVGYNQITVVPVNSISVNTPTPACRPQNVNLFANALTAISYSWSGPNSYTANTANTILYYPPISASGLYTVTATFTNGGITCVNNNTVAVSVNAVPNFTLSDFLRGCYNTTFTVPGPADPSYTYSWTSTTGFSSNTQNLVLAPAKPQQSGTYYLTVAQGPCSSMEQVEIEILTPIQFTLVPLDREKCKGDTALFEVAATGGSENYAYNWNPSSYLSSPTGSTVIGNMQGTTIFNVTANDIACPNYTINHTFNVNVKQPPVPDLQLSATEGCAPLCLFYDSKTEGTSTITTYDFGGVRKYQIDATTICIDEPGTYHLKIYTVGLNGCLGTYNYQNDIIVDPNSNADIQWSPEVPNTTDNVVTFNAVPKAGTIAYYDWMFTGTGVSGHDSSNLKSPVRKFEDTGIFPVMLVTTTDKGCTDTTIKYLDIKDELTLFIPNSFTPNGDGVNDLFQVKGLGFRAGNFILEIFDRWGHVIYSTNDFLKGWDGSIKGSGPVEGVYTYRVRLIGSNGEGRKEYLGHVTLLK